MKKLIFTGIIAFLGFSLSAQPGPSDKNPEDIATRMTEKMTEALKLSEDQATQVFEVNYDFAKEIIAASESRKQIHHAHRKELSEILTEEQMEKLDQQMQKRREKRKYREHEKKSVPGELQKD